MIRNGCPGQLSGIVRIADDAAREVLLIAQDDMDPRVRIAHRGTGAELPPLTPP